MKLEFISLGGTPNPSASVWDQESGILAFGAGRVVALWKPNDGHRGVFATLNGHNGKVTAVTFLTGRLRGGEIIVSGGEDKSIKIWGRRGAAGTFACILTVDAHSGSITSLSAESKETGHLLASASSDGSVRIWEMGPFEGKGHGSSSSPNRENGEPRLECIQEIVTKPKFFPLAVAVSDLSSIKGTKGSILAIAGTTSSISVYVATGEHVLDTSFVHVATLVGHENWVRSLSFARDPREPSTSFSPEKLPDLILASGSQDKYIRLWRIHRGLDIPKRTSSVVKVDMGRALSNKAHMFRVDEGQGSYGNYSITFEALLVGHDDWVYTVNWKSQGTASPLQLLSASADNSLSIWEPDNTTGIWTPISRLGQINATKGASTATGSTGGFWVGLWAPDGLSVVALGKNGSWRMWTYDELAVSWSQIPSVSGHVRDVTEVVWEPEGRFLLSTSLDQTTRLFAQWQTESTTSWHEFSRPQIHGYNINCAAFVGPNRFVSGADEKLLRVFDEPKVTASLLEQLCGVRGASKDSMPEAASVPALGLSNKAEGAMDSSLPSNGCSKYPSSAAGETSEASIAASLDLSRPPLEDDLSRHTLWPEVEKLYGHGFEISAATGSHNGLILATSCKASSLDHAVIRLFDCNGWRQIKPPLKSHTLTINRLIFSGDDQFLLSVGRDRQWTIFKNASASLDNKVEFQTHIVMAKAHSRVIWDGSWAPIESRRMIATGSRDKTVKIWQNTENDPSEWPCTATLKFPDAVRAVEFFKQTVTLKGKESLILAIGLENGAIYVYGGHLGTCKSVQEWNLLTSPNPSIVPDKAVTRISWRPRSTVNDNEKFEIAVASEDCSMRIYSLTADDMVKSNDNNT